MSINSEADKINSISRKFYIIDNFCCPNQTVEFRTSELDFKNLPPCLSREQDEF